MPNTSPKDGSRTTYCGMAGPCDTQSNPLERFSEPGIVTNSIALKKVILRLPVLDDTRYQKARAFATVPRSRRNIGRSRTPEPPPEGGKAPKG